MQLLQSLTTNQFFGVFTPQKASLIEDFAYIVAARNQPGEMKQLLTLLTAPAFGHETRFQVSALTGLGKGLKKLKTKPVDDPQLNLLLQKMEAASGKEVRSAVDEVRKSLKN
jgi:hypothetical protein